MCNHKIHVIKMSISIKNNRKSKALFQSVHDRFRLEAQTDLSISQQSNAGKPKILNINKDI
jgi:hypothetical protein